MICPEKGNWLDSPTATLVATDGSNPDAEQHRSTAYVEQDGSNAKVVKDGSTAKTEKDLVALDADSQEAKAMAKEPRCKDFGFLPIPSWLRYRPDYHFALWTNMFFGLNATFTVANLYYSQPLLLQIAATLDVTYDEASLIVTMAQAGYAAGMLLVSPLGDLVYRRELLLSIQACATLLTVGLAVTKSYQVFMALSFLIGVVTVSPQVLITLAADLSPPERRGRAIAITLSGLMLGVLCARVIAGIIAEFTYWQLVFRIACGLQALIWLCSWLTVPDTPKKTTGLNYFQVLGTMIKYAFTEPILIFSGLQALCGSVQFSDLWTTLTFLLGGEPYNYSTLVIGLFGLLGCFAVCCAPLAGRIVDKLVPHAAIVLAHCVLLLGQLLMLVAGKRSVAIPIISIVCVDLGAVQSNVANSTRMYGIEPSARARMNAVYILMLFIGQVVGSSVGSVIYLHAGYRANAAFCMAFSAFALFLLAIRGPWEERYTWFGWKAGHSMRKRQSAAPPSKAQAESSLSEEGSKEEEKVGGVELDEKV